ncbi:MAG: 50S ribosomal protein L10 [Chloroflexi bacterium]|nr:50S ribosomal protein L10 [Chloroflexota bacterium]
MPTPKKESQVEEIKDRLGRCTIAVATGYQGMSAANMTDLRERLRGQGVEYRVIKNTLTLRAASELGKEGMDSVLQGPSALAFGYGDVVAVAKGINEYITTTRMPLVIQGAMMDGNILTAAQVINLASLPPKDQLIARLLGQLQAPITGLVYVLSAPLRGLVTVLQRAADQRQGQSQPGEGSLQTTEASIETAEAAPEPEAAVETVAEADAQENP